jgi:hypothetical protein
MQAKESNWLSQIDKKSPLKKSAKQNKANSDAARRRSLKLKPACMKGLGKNRASQCPDKKCPCWHDICLY